MHKVLAHAGRPGRLWQQNHCGVYRSDDGGDSWERVDYGFPLGVRLRACVGPGDPDAAFVIPRRALIWLPADGRIGIIRTTDAGASWELIVAEEPAWAAVLREAMSQDAEAVYGAPRAGTSTNSTPTRSSRRRGTCRRSSRSKPRPRPSGGDRAPAGLLGDRGRWPEQVDVAAATVGDAVRALPVRDLVLERGAARPRSTSTSTASARTT